MRRLFNLIIDLLLFFGDLICHMPSRFGAGCEKVLEWFSYVFTRLPYRISLIYRFRRMWYPAKSEFKSHNLTKDMEKWLDEDLGKYRWKIVSRSTKGEYSNYPESKKYLCFRYKTDAMAFKLRWME